MPDNWGTSPVCASGNEPRWQLVYALQAGKPNNYGNYYYGIVEYFRRAVGVFLQESYKSSANQEPISIRTGCGQMWGIVVADDTEEAIQQALIDVGGFFRNYKYLVFYDGDSTRPNYGRIWTDARRLVANDNNGVMPGEYPLSQGGVPKGGEIAKISPGAWSTYTVVHEMAHAMGAVQPGAPNANGLFHCNDGIDVLCYGEGGQPYSEVPCPESSLSFGGGTRHVPLDCGRNTYFNTSMSPGSYLSTHWNLGWSGNRFTYSYYPPTGGY